MHDYSDLMGRALLPLIVFIPWVLAFAVFALLGYLTLSRALLIPLSIFSGRRFNSNKFWKKNGVLAGIVVIYSLLVIMGRVVAENEGWT